LVDCGLVWRTLPRGLSHTLTIQLVQLSLIVQVTWAPPTYDRSGHMSSTCLAPSDCPSQASSFINVASSLSSRCPSNMVLLFLRATHNVPRVLHGQMTWVVYPWLHAPCTDKQCKETWSAPHAWYKWAIWTSGLMGLDIQGMAH